jgi:hypothetical protein
VLDSVLKRELILAVHQSRTNSVKIKQIAELYQLLQMGVSLDIDNLDAETGELLLMFSQEIAKKQEKDAKIQQMKSRMK